MWTYVAYMVALFTSALQMINLFIIDFVYICIAKYT